MNWTIDQFEGLGNETKPKNEHGKSRGNELEMNGGNEPSKTRGNEPKEE